MTKQGEIKSLEQLISNSKEKIKALKESVVRVNQPVVGKKYWLTHNEQFCHIAGGELKSLNEGIEVLFLGNFVIPHSGGRNIFMTSNSQYIMFTALRVEDYLSELD